EMRFITSTTLEDAYRLIYNSPSYVEVIPSLFGMIDEPPIHIIGCERDMTIRKYVLSFGETDLLIIKILGNNKFLISLRKNKSNHVTHYSLTLDEVLRNVHLGISLKGPIFEKTFDLPEKKLNNLSSFDVESDASKDII